MQPILFQGLVLREFHDGDAEAFAQAARESVNTVGRWMPWCNASFSPQDALSWFQQCRMDLASERAYEFGVFSQESGALLGGAGLNSINHQNLFCNLGYWVRESAQRKGVALRTVQALVHHAFHTLGMQRVEIVIASGNTPSEAVARKYGAQLECIARNRLQLRGIPVPALVFAVIP
ncbi:GNAT family N-acetyltransferase [Pollutimonas bauzanensis]|uniref:GNAT family N-acetyltransferase n=1 Tax=Pollutimonas bauzanensis TaxID=658167 RepID=UPI0009330703|nr:GNAT family N-acetyltransferase [Pollutimonas bauzanensis]